MSWLINRLAYYHFIIEDLDMNIKEDLAKAVLVGTVTASCGFLAKRVMEFALDGTPIARRKLIAEHKKKQQQQSANK